MMKKLSKIALLAAASAFMLAVFPACGDDEDDPSVEITGGDSVTIGETLELTAVVSDFPEFGVAYDWSSSDESVATVVADSEAPSKATVTPVAEGKATITVTASVGGTVAIAAIEVSVKSEGTDDDGQSKVENYVLDITTIPETTGDTKKLDDTVTVISTAKNSGGSDQTIKYSSNGYVQMSGAKAQSTYGLQLTLPKAATITVEATKKNNGTATAIVLLSSDGSAEVAKTSGIDEYNAASRTEYTLDVTDAGTYILGADANGCFVYSLKITYK